MVIMKPRTWIEISQSAFEHNIQYYRNLIGNCMLAVVVKANAYGHGLHEIGSLCQHNNQVNWLCTASLSEALSLRKHGITKPILVMSTIFDDDPVLAYKYNIDLIADNYDTIFYFNKIGADIKKKISIHIKIDTGMSRFGLSTDEALPCITKTLTLPYITINGIYSHFSESANSDFFFTQQQLYAFTKIIKELTRHGISIPYYHIANSAAVSSLVLQHTNFVRLGAGAYGLIPFNDNDMIIHRYHTAIMPKQILTWKTKIINIKKVPAHSFIGYDRSYQTTQETTIAIIPIGYYDGYDRRLTNQGIIFIRINNSYAPVIGRICMNVTMIDISTIDNVRIGDEVLIIGPYQSITANSIAKKIGCYNPREVTTRLNVIIPRIVTP